MFGGNGGGGGSGRERIKTSRKPNLNGNRLRTVHEVVEQDLPLTPHNDRSELAQTSEVLRARIIAVTRVPTLVKRADISCVCQLLPEAQTESESAECARRRWPAGEGHA